MILVVGQYPDATNSRDGMVQRIAAVDRLLEPHERTYLTLVHEPFRDTRAALKRVAPRVRSVQLNWFDAGDVELLSGLVKEARCLVVHSLHWAQHVLPLYRARPVITDLHGVVPEEHAFVGAHEEAAHFASVERAVMRHGFRHIAVSDAMADHFRTRYAELKPSLFTLPVLAPPTERPALDERKGASLRILYSGGTHAWQNIDLMLDSIARSRLSLPVELLTPDVTGMRERVARRKLEARVSIRSLPPERMPEAYAQAHLGFVLRDDNLVNRAACPTKLQEYLAHGVVPIVLSPHIGDFATMGYRYVSLDAFLEGRLPVWAEWRELAEHNLQVLEKLRRQADTGVERFAEAVELALRTEARPGVSVEEELAFASLFARRMSPSRERTRHVPLPLLRRLLP